MARVSRHRIAVTPPYRLDLTVTVLRRLSVNLVDRLVADGTYLRALEEHARVIVAVRQTSPRALAVTLTGAGDHAAALATARRMLGADRDLRRFTRSASRVRWLAPLAVRMRGVRPPRYPTLWEAFVNAVVYQQLSVIAATAITSRLVETVGRRVEQEGETLYVFPTPRAFLAASDRELLALGLSRTKLATLRRAATAIAARAIDVDALEVRSSEDAAAVLRAIKGIGPWSAALILLRGLGRLDVFPYGDSSVARNLRLVGGAATVRRALEMLGPDKGMLYYHLLLARLETRGEVGRSST